MKIVNCLLLLCGFSQYAYTQVSGKLITGGGKPLPSANILLLNSIDSTVVKAGLSSDSGLYRFDNVAKGAYMLRVSSTGYILWHSPAFVLSDAETQKDFGTLVMVEDSKALEEVIIKAEKPIFQQKAEGTVVNVERSLLSKGSTVLQVLERSPGVLINHRDNSIELNGKSGVTVMLNGKPIRMSMEQVVNLLSGMSADNIATIELLTTPPAKYDAEGSAGLINIVLKKNKQQGTNGSVSLTAGYGYGEKGVGSFNLSHNGKRVNVYGSYTFSHNKTYSELYITSKQHMPFLGGNAEVLFMDTTHVTHNDHDAAIGVDIKADTKTTIGANITFNNSTASRATYNNADYTILPDSLLQFRGLNRGTSYWTSVVNSIYIERVMNDREKLNFDMDYLYFNNNGPYQVQSSFIDKHGQQAGSDESLFSPQQKGFAHTSIKVGVVKMDYAAQLNKSIKFETGFKASATGSSSVSGIESLINDVWTVNGQAYNDIRMKEYMGAAYISANAKVNPVTDIAVGVRYEYSATRMRDIKTGKTIADRKLGAFFPDIFISRKIKEGQELQLSYTKRITRPSYNDLASYVGYSDPTAVYTGNPFLKPAITHNIKLGYTYGRYAFSLLFSRDNYAISRYQLSESPASDMLYISPQNLRWQNNITAQVSAPFKIGEWWTMNYSFIGGYRKYKVGYTIEPFEKAYFGYSFNFSETFRLPKNFSAELSGWYNSNSYNGTVKIDGYAIVNIGIKKELKNNKGSFQLSVSDILRNETIHVYYGKVTREAFDIKSNVRVTLETAKFPIIKLTYAKSFGSSASKAKRITGSGDEQTRIRKE